MLSVLKYDLYKMVHSRRVYVVFFMAAILEISMNGASNSWFTGNFVYWFDDGFWGVCYSGFSMFYIPLFLAVFVGLDFSSRAINNVYSNVNKFYYVLSKVICAFIFLLTVHLARFVVVLIFCLANNKGKAIDTSAYGHMVSLGIEMGLSGSQVKTYYIIAVLKDLLYYLLNQITFISFLTIFAFLIKRGAVFYIGYLIYFVAVRQRVYDFISAKFGKIMLYYIPTTFVCPSNVQPRTFMYPGVQVYQWLQCIMCIVVTAASLIASWQIFKRRRV